MNARSKALKHFKKADPRLHKAAKPYVKHLPEELGGRKNAAQLFESLCSIVVSQQLGTKAADAIYVRFKAACGGKVTPESVLKTPESKLRASGLSGAKTKTLKAVAAATKAKQIDFLGLKSIARAEAESRLTEIWGIGPWSAEMFLMFSLGHPDIFSLGDLGLIRGVEQLYGLPKDVSRTKIEKISLKWAPHRSYASLILWRVKDATPPLKLAKGRHR